MILDHWRYMTLQHIFKVFIYSTNTWQFMLQVINVQIETEKVSVNRFCYKLKGNEKSPRDIN